MPHTCTNGTPVEKTIKQQATLSNFEFHLRPGRHRITFLATKMTFLNNLHLEILLNIYANYMVTDRFKKTKSKWYIGMRASGSQNLVRTSGYGGHNLAPLVGAPDR